MFDNAHYLTRCFRERGRLELLGEAKYLPVIVARFKEEKPYTVYDVSRVMREKGWIIPAYTLPPDADDIAVLRIVIREDFSREMADALAEHAAEVYDRLNKSGFKGEALPKGKGARGIC
jgi:glutamate decarboxylase